MVAAAARERTLRRGLSATRLTLIERGAYDALFSCASSATRIRWTASFLKGRHETSYDSPVDGGSDPERWHLRERGERVGCSPSDHHQPGPALRRREPAHQRHLAGALLALRRAQRDGPHLERGAFGHLRRRLL